MQSDSERCTFIPEAIPGIIWLYTVVNAGRKYALNATDK